MAKAKTKKPRTWFVQKLIEMGACSEAIRYAKKHRTFPAAWRNCEAASWLAWLVRNTDGLLPDHSGIAVTRCPRCKWDNQHHTRSLIYRRFTAERVAKALRKVKA